MEPVSPASAGRLSRSLLGSFEKSQSPAKAPDMQVEVYVMAAKRDIAEGHSELPDNKDYTLN